MPPKLKRNATAIFRVTIRTRGECFFAAPPYKVSRLDIRRHPEHSRYFTFACSRVLPSLTCSDCQPLTVSQPTRFSISAWLFVRVLRNVTTSLGLSRLAIIEANSFYAHQLVVRETNSTQDELISRPPGLADKTILSCLRPTTPALPRVEVSDCYDGILHKCRWPDPFSISYKSTVPIENRQI